MTACSSAWRARRSALGGASDEVVLVAVTKSVEPEVAAELVRLGQVDLGENRAPELERKAAHFAERAATPGGGKGLAPRWHFIGHLQRNKARRVVRLAHSIHSVDSLALLETLQRVAGEEGRRPRIYLQVDVAGEDSKGGFDPAEVPAALERARACHALVTAGLMAMAPLAAPAERAANARATFAELARIAGELPRDAFEDGRPRLSMGMSADFELAIEEGADLVRVGSALFGSATHDAPEGARGA